MEFSTLKSIGLHPASLSLLWALECIGFVYNQSSSYQSQHPYGLGWKQLHFPEE